MLISTYFLFLRVFVPSVRITHALNIESKNEQTNECLGLEGGQVEFRGGGEEGV